MDLHRASICIQIRKEEENVNSEEEDVEAEEDEDEESSADELMEEEEILSEKQEHSGSAKGKTFVCPECGKVFNAHYNLTRHMPVHTGARPFVCKVMSHLAFTPGPKVHKRDPLEKVP